MRCHWTKHEHFHYYGGRGIKICDRWNKFENFFADMGPRVGGTTLDRINPNGNYEPGNCRWATPQQQSENRRNSVTVVVGQKTFATAKNASLELGISSEVIRYRIKSGLAVDSSVVCRKHKHRLLHVSETSETGKCAQCGDVKIVRRGAGWRCAIARSEQRGKKKKRT